MRSLAAVTTSHGNAAVKVTVSSLSPTRVCNVLTLGFGPHRLNGLLRVVRFSGHEQLQSSACYHLP